MKRLLLLIPLLYAVICMGQDDVPVFTDKDLESGGYEGSGMSVTGNEGLEKPKEAPKPVTKQPETLAEDPDAEIPIIEGSGYFNCWRGSHMDVSWLTLSNINVVFVPTERPKTRYPDGGHGEGGLWCTVPISFTVRTTPDSPARETFEVMYAFEKLNFDGTADNA